MLPIQTMSEKAKKCADRFDKKKKEYFGFIEEVKAGPLETVTDRSFFYNDKARRISALFEELFDLNCDLNKLRRKNECKYNPSVFNEIALANEDVFKFIALKQQELNQSAIDVSTTNTTVVKEPQSTPLQKITDHTQQSQDKVGDNSSLDFSEDEGEDVVDANNKDRRIRVYVHHAETLLSILYTTQENLETFTSIKVIQAKKDLIHVKIKDLKDFYNSLSIIQQEKIILSDRFNVSYLENQGNDLSNTLTELQEYFEDSKQSAERETNQNTRSTTSAYFPNVLAANGLPVIPIPDFEGDSLKWPAFESLFRDRVINARGLTDNTKLMYLNESVKGAAKRFLGDLIVGADSFQETWGKLVEHYTHRRNIVDSITDTMFNMPNVREDSAEDLQSFYTNVNDGLKHFKTQNIEMGSFEPVVARLMYVKLDKNTRTLFDMSVENERECYTIEQILKFVLKRINSCKHIKNKDLGKWSSKVDKYNLSPCIKCNSNHSLQHCYKYREMTVDERISFIKSKNLCSNCLKKSHGECKVGRCFKCNEKHHTTIHVSKKEPGNSKVSNPLNKNKGKSQNSTSHNVVADENKKFVFLGTAEVKVKNSLGEEITCRALLDPGSQVNVISKSLVDRLGLKGRKGSGKISGIGAKDINTVQKISLEITKKKFKTRIEAQILPQITKYLPNEKELPLTSLVKKQLADRKYFQPDSIDLLIGGGVWAEILVPRIRRYGSQKPILQFTKLGFVVMGAISSNSISEACNIICEEEQYNEGFPKLWDLEEVPRSKPLLSVNEQIAEKIFLETTTRNEDGRFIVALAKHPEFVELGKSDDIARRRFYSLEQRFQKDPKFQKAYKDNIHEWINLGHAEYVSLDELQNHPKYFIPHHAVIKESSTTTKLRVVFDASVKTSNNLCLNDILLKGPTVQDDLFNILLRFRFPKYVMSADVEKMYRQVIVDSKDQFYQLIFWRDNPSDDLSILKLKTVIFGTSSAPYLATKCLIALADENESEFPLASKIIKRDFYMDDLITGFDDLNSAEQAQKDLRSILSSCGFNLRKWCSNHPQLLKDLPSEDVEMEWDFQNSESTIKTLGLIWNPKIDNFQISARSLKQKKKLTKRVISSECGQIFDPLGLVNPAVMVAKLILQKLWQLNIDWDHALPKDIQGSWQNFRDQLPLLEKLKIPRKVVIDNPIHVELHGFSDASEKAYGAVIYIKSVNSSGETLVRLLTAKSKVAPTKQVTLARLELCAAKMLSDFVDKIKESLNYKVDKVFLWTDSTITLCWIKRPSKSFKTFVANRVAQIQEVSAPEDWYHVPGEQNPADIVSRGMLPIDLIASKLWFEGPEFLTKNQCDWPSQNLKIDPTLSSSEDRSVETCNTLVEEKHFIESIKHNNSFNRLKRVVAYILRFIRNCKAKHAHRTRSKKTIKHVEPVSVSEFQNSELEIIRYIQKFHNLTEKINKTYKNLSPFTDDQGIIRVGGRLKHSDLPFDSKHQILIPKCELSRIIIRSLHLLNFHSAPQTLHSICRKKYWITGGKALTSTVFRECIRCCRIRPKNIHQLMGNLPSTRVTSSAPFECTGVDYAGPFTVHYTLRGKRPTKAYLAVFVCFATKAVHLEVVSDLTTQSFLGCLKRFIARRGKPKHIYSDNATNFVGAREELKLLKEFFLAHNKDITLWNTEQDIEWSNIPARSPHFGGLWEAAVKRAKFHLKDLVNSNSLTFEELNTAVVEVEAILNMRPLTPISENPNDLRALTPMDFLIQGSSEPLQEEDFRNIKNHLLKRWKIVSKIRQLFWERWSSEYLHTLQQKGKWLEKRDNIKAGTMVLLKEDNIPSLQWKLARVLEAIPGKDGLVRVVKLKTNNGETLRAITKISPLPVEVDSVPNN